MGIEPGTQVCGPYPLTTELQPRIHAVCGSIPEVETPNKYKFHAHEQSPEITKATVTVPDQGVHYFGA